MGRWGTGVGYPIAGVMAAVCPRFSLCKSHSNGIKAIDGHHWYPMTQFNSAAWAELSNVAMSSIEPQPYTMLLAFVKLYPMMWLVYFQLGCPVSLLTHNTHCALWGMIIFWRRFLKGFKPPSLPPPYILLGKLGFFSRNMIEHSHTVTFPHSQFLHCFGLGIGHFLVVQQIKMHLKKITGLIR